MKNQASQSRNPRNSGVNSISGNVLILILIAVALFGSLSYAMMQGSRVGSGTITGEQAKLTASEMISYAERGREAYKKMLISGCTVSNISFGNSVKTDAQQYPIPGTTPANGSCSIFDARGGGLSYTSFNELRQPAPTHPGFSYSLSIVEGVGTASAEPVFVLSHLSNDVCQQINLQLNGVAEIYPAAAGIGVILNTGDNLDAASCAKCAGKRAGCVLGTSNNFYYVLQAQ